MSDETGAVEEGGVGEQAWLSSVPETLRGHEVFSSMKEAGEVYQRLTDLSDQSKGMVTIPSEESTPEARSAFYSKLGKPTSHDGYEFDTIDLPEGREPDKVLNETIRKVAFEENVPAKALKALHKAVSEHGVTQHNDVQALIKEQNEKDTNALKNIWQGDSFKENVEKSERAFKAIVEKLNVPDALGGKEGMMEEFKVMGFLDDSNPKFRYFMAEMFNLIGDDTFIEGLEGSGKPKETSKTDSGYSMMSFPSMEGKN